MKNKFLTSTLSFLIIFFLGVIMIHAQGLPTSNTNNPTPTSNTNNPPPTSVTNNPPAVSIPIKIANPFNCGGQRDENGGCTIEALLIAIVDKIVMPIGGILCVLAFIFAGFQYVVAQGNPSKIATAHRTLLYAAIGTALLLGAKVFATVIKNTINQLT